MKKLGSKPPASRNTCRSTSIAPPQAKSSGSPSCGPCGQSGQPAAGWPDCPHGPQEGDPLLFACGGAMLVDRQVFLDAGGFDPSFFIYFEDVDLGWRLWVL